MREWGQYQLMIDTDQAIKISIIVPIYRIPEEYLRIGIESLIGQTIKEIEILLIDDGSPDKCGEICDEYAAQDDRIKVFHQENRGVSAARNAGIKKAAGEWICFVDGDDCLPADALEAMYEVIGNADIVIGNYSVVKNGKIKEEKFFSYKISRMDKHEPLYLIGNALGCSLYGACASANIGVPWGKLYRKEFLVKEGKEHIFPDIKRMQDTIFNIELFLSEAKIVYLEKAVYYYRVVENSAVHRYTPDFDHTAEKILRGLKPLLLEDNNSKFIELYYFKKASLLLENIRLVYGHPKCELNIKEKVNGMRILCKDKKIQDIKKKCRRELFTNKQRLLLSLLNTGYYRVVLFLYYLKNEKYEKYN